MGISLITDQKICEIYQLGLMRQSELLGDRDQLELNYSFTNLDLTDRLGELIDERKANERP